MRIPSAYQHRSNAELPKKANAGNNVFSIISINEYLFLPVKNMLYGIKTRIKCGRFSSFRICFCLREEIFQFIYSLSVIFPLLLR